MITRRNNDEHKNNDNNNNNTDNSNNNDDKKSKNENSNLIIIIRLALKKNVLCSSCNMVNESVLKGFLRISHLTSRPSYKSIFRL